MTIITYKIKFIDDSRCTNECYKEVRANTEHECIHELISYLNAYNEYYIEILNIERISVEFLETA